MKTDLQKVTINLYRGDMEKLQTIYHKTGGGAAIREIVHTHLAKIEARATPVKLEEVPVE